MLVSVYVPSKDRVESLQRCMASVLGQTYPDLELLVVNDGSRDGTRDYLDATAAADPRVRAFHHDTPRGAPEARNRAIREARGHFVTGLDDDDRFAPERLRVFVDAWTRAVQDRPDLACLYSQDRFERDGVVTLTTTKPAAVASEEMLIENRVGSQIFSTREKYLAAGLFDPAMPAWQDMEFFFRFLRVHGPAQRVDAATYIYDDSERTDRISLNPRKLRAALRLFSEKHLAADPAGRAALTMQLLTRYAVDPEVGDLMTLAADGDRVRNVYRLLRAQARRRLRT